MSNLENGSSTKGWRLSEHFMTTSPSVGRFSNDQAPSLYVKGSTAKFTDNDRRKTMAPYNNHGQLSQQATQQPGSGIVDLRTAPVADGKPMEPAKSTQSSDQR